MRELYTKIWFYQQIYQGFPVRWLIYMINSGDKTKLFSLIILYTPLIVIFSTWKCMVIGYIRNIKIQLDNEAQRTKTIPHSINYEETGTSEGLWDRLGRRKMTNMSFLDVFKAPSFALVNSASLSNATGFENVENDIFVIRTTSSLANLVWQGTESKRILMRLKHLTIKRHYTSMLRHKRQKH